MSNDWSDEETDDPLRADDRNFYKVEKWTKDGTKIEQLIYAGNNLEKARDLFASAIKHFDSGRACSFSGQRNDSRSRRRPGAS
jgi:hypothetical protein